MNIQQIFICFLTLVFYLPSVSAGQIKVDNRFRNSDYFITINNIIQTNKMDRTLKDTSLSKNKETNNLVSNELPTLINRHSFESQNNFFKGQYADSVGYARAFQDNNQLESKNIALSLLEQKKTDIAPCHPTGGTICPDVVSLPILLAFERFFTLKKEDYLFELLGFNVDEIDFKHEFIPENDPMKRIQLYGKTTFLANKITLPATLFLYLLGLILFMMFLEIKRIKHAPK